MKEISLISKLIKCHWPVLFYNLHFSLTSSVVELVSIKINSVN